MRLICITDIHGDLESLDEILVHAGVFDVILLGGDLTNFGTPDDAEQIVRRVQDACPHVFAVAGNCDSASIDRRLEDLNVGIFGRGIVHGNVGFYGVSAMPPWQGTMYELSENEIADALEKGRSELAAVEMQVMLSHPPPRDTATDLTRNQAHVGSSAVRRAIERFQPALVVCGHIHEARGIDQLGETTIVNCGPAYCGYYAIADLAHDVRVELREANA